MESKSAIPDGNAEKRIENSKSYRRPLVRENLIQKAAKRYQNPFTTSVRKYRGLRGLVPEWEWALEVASLLVKLASSVPNRQVYVTSLEATWETYQVERQVSVHTRAFSHTSSRLIHRKKAIYLQREKSKWLFSTNWIQPSIFPSLAIFPADLRFPFFSPETFEINGV